MTRISLVGLMAGGHSGIPRYTTAVTQEMDGLAPEFPSLELTAAPLSTNTPSSHKVRQVVHRRRRSFSIASRMLLKRSLRLLGFRSS